MFSDFLRRQLTVVVIIGKGGLREGSLAMGIPIGRAWVEPKGKPIPLPEEPPGEPRETAYNAGEVYTFTEIQPGDGEFPTRGTVYVTERSMSLLRRV